MAHVPALALLKESATDSYPSQNRCELSVRTPAFFLLTWTPESLNQPTVTGKGEFLCEGMSWKKALIFWHLLSATFPALVCRSRPPYPVTFCRQPKSELVIWVWMSRRLRPKRARCLVRICTLSLSCKASVGYKGAVSGRHCCQQSLPKLPDMQTHTFPDALWPPICWCNEAPWLKTAQEAKNAASTEISPMATIP